MPPNRRPRRSPGALPLTSERDLYSSLMRQGVSNAAACRIVGVNRKTGHRWRYGRTITIRTGEIRTYPAITRPAHPVSARFLSEAERVAIADGLIRRRSIRSLAAELGRAPSTVSREIRRNRDTGTEVYHPFRAQRRAAGRRVRPKLGKLVYNAELRAFVQGHLEQRWSPEQISRALPGLFPGRPEMRVVHETIYQALYAQGPGRLRRDPAGLLRSGRIRRKRRRRSGERLGRFIAPMVMIGQRPAEVAARVVAGHWEGDLIMGTSNRSAIGTLVERTTRYLVLLHLPNGHGAEHVRDALVDAVSVLPARVRRSLTWDQGVEMGRHDEFTLATNVPVYFCDRASPWQRGTNENTNGLLRQYFPKGTDLSAHTAERLAIVAADLNTRPRKTLGWETPSRRLDRLLSSTA
jgi:transposase, IS30 family